MNKTKIIYNFKGYNIEGIKKIAKFEKKISKIHVTGLLDHDTIENIIDLIKKTKKLNDYETVWILIAGLLQSGGTNKGTWNSIIFTYDNYFLSAQELQSLIKKVKKNATNRQLARTIADQIVEIAIELNISGDLAEQMRYEHPDLSEIEKIWCSNFQTTNPNCPKRVRNWLVFNYKNRFNQ